MKFYYVAILTLMAYVSLSQVPIEKLELNQFDISDGLSENIAVSIVQDQEGYIWIGTLDGLNRFDGSNFKVYRDEIFLDSISLNNRIYNLREDHNNNLWVYKDEGVVVFNPRTERLVNIDFIKEYRPRITAIADEAHSWVYVQSQVMLVDRNYDIVKKFDVDIDKYFPKDVSWWFNKLLVKDDANIFLVSSLGYILELNTNSGIFKLHDKLEFPDFDVSSYAIDGDGNIWMSSRAGSLYKYNPESMQLDDVNSMITNEPQLYNNIFYDKKFNLVLISTRQGGLFEYNVDTDTWKNYEIKAPGKKSPNSENILSILRDKNDVLWFGTDQHGVLLHDPYLKKFEAINPLDLGLEWDIRMPRKIIGDEHNNLWIGTNTLGLWRYDLEDGVLENYTNSSHPDMMESNSAIQLFADGDDLYVGHNGKGISVIDIPSLELKKRFFVISQDEKIKSTNIIWNFFKDKQERLWVGTRESGLYIIDGDKIEHYHYYNSSLIQSDIQGIDEFADGRIIITNRIGGLYEWDEENKDFIKRFPNIDLKVAPKAIKEDHLGNIWVGTDGQGIYLLDKDFQIVDHLNTKNGALKSDVTCSFIEDDDNNMWVSTNYGISKFTRKEDGKGFKYGHFNISDGLNSDEFMTGAYHKEGDRLWMGNIAGVNYFYPRQIKSNPNTAEVCISNFEVFNNKLETDSSIYSLDKVVLEQGQNAFSVEYSAKGFNVPSKTYYKYRLLGYDEDWSNQTLRQYASYTNLDPGDYTFQVKATNYDGIWSEEATELNVHLKPSISQTLAFKVMALLSAIFLGFLIYRYRIAQIKERERIKTTHDAELSQMEMKALRAQINPHFLFNTLNSINNFILQKDGKNASSYLVKFSQLMRNMLGNSSNSYITISEELETLELYIQLESMRFNHKFDYFINVDYDLKIEDKLIPPMLLQPFVENAIWHGLLHKDGDNLLEVNIGLYKEDGIKFTIRDNGIGIEKSKEINRSSSKGKSYGMDITKKRIELFNKAFDRTQEKSFIQVINLKDDKGKAAGTEINLVVPKIVKEKIFA